MGHKQISFGWFVFEHMAPVKVTFELSIGHGEKLHEFGLGYELIIHELLDVIHESAILVLAILDIDVLGWGFRFHAMQGSDIVFYLILFTFVQSSFPFHLPRFADSIKLTFWACLSLDDCLLSSGVRSWAECCLTHWHRSFGKPSRRLYTNRHHFFLLFFGRCLQEYIGSIKEL